MGDILVQRRVFGKKRKDPDLGSEEERILVTENETSCGCDLRRLPKNSRRIAPFMGTRKGYIGSYKTSTEEEVLMKTMAILKGPADETEDADSS